MTNRLPVPDIKAVQFPAFARFLLNDRLDRFTKEVVHLSRELNIPILKYFSSFSKEEIEALSLRSAKEWLTYLSDNKPQESIEVSVHRWVKDQLPQVEKDQVVVDDISLATLMRKKALLKFIPEFTSDLSLAIGLIHEIDVYFTEYLSTMVKTFVNLLESRISEQQHFNTKITETLPGIVYVYDRVNNKELYTNRMLTERLGYTHDDLQQMGDNILKELIHPDDSNVIARHMARIGTLKDRDIAMIEYRIRANDNAYRWQRTYESVFKRTEDGSVSQTIGIAFDVENEKEIADQLKHRESQLLEAQELTNMGSFEWNLTTQEGNATEQIYKIIGIPHNAKADDFIARVHRDDLERVKREVERALNHRTMFEAEFRVNVENEEKYVWSRANVIAKKDQVLLRGTLIDVTQRHRIIQRLQESEALYKEAQSVTHIGNYVWDLEKNKLLWSDELYRIYGLEPRSEITNEIVAQYNHPQDVVRVREHIQQSKETLQPFDFLYRIILGDGTEKILQAKGRTVADEHGKPVEIIGTAQDVTERQSLITQLQTSEMLYKQAQALAHIGNWEWNVSQNIVSWTDELYRIFGLEPQSDQITYEKYLSLIYPEDRELLIQRTKNSLEQKIPNEFYHRVQWKDGTVRIIHSKSEVQLNEDGDVIRLFGTAQDVTEQKLNEKKLNDNQNFIHKIANATPTLIASYNINTGKYVFISEGLKKLLGYDTRQALDEGVSFFMQIIHPEDIAPLMEKNTLALQQANAEPPAPGAEEKIIEFQYRMKHQDGRYRWFHTFGTVFDRNKDNKVEHVLNISLDVTERIQAEQILYQKTLELQQSNANLEEFAFVASHDLKEPLRKISTFSDRLLMSYRDKMSGEGIIFLEKIMASSLRMQQMVSDLLSLSMISGDKTFKHCSLQKLWEDVVVSFEHKIEETHAVLNVQLLPEAFVVPSQFRQLFQNLLSNSLKFTKPGVIPEIILTYEFLSSREAEQYRLRDAEHYLKLVFSDNGIGFDNIYVEKIFAIFQRLHQKEAYEGTGIGLAICKKIVENHGGSMQGSGHLGKGATFTIILPC
jgi:PAS domain S-box-containing protein